MKQITTFMLRFENIILTMAELISTSLVKCFECTLYIKVCLIGNSNTYAFISQNFLLNSSLLRLIITFLLPQIQSIWAWPQKQQIAESKFVPHRK